MKVQDWYQRLPERDQQIALLGGAVAGVLLIALLAWWLGASVASAETRVERRREDLAFIETVTPRLQAMPSGRPDEPLTIAVDRMASEGGLADTLAAVEPAANGALRARFTGASFDALVLLLARLQKERGVEAETASVTASGEPGLVDATIVIRGP
jgi:type II secretory pathway component PulM